MIYFSSPQAHSPSSALVSSILRLQKSLSSADLLQFLRFNVLLAFLPTASIHVPLCRPTGLLPSRYPLKAILGILSSFAFVAWPTHRSLLNLILFDDILYRNISRVTEENHVKHVSVVVLRVEIWIHDLPYTEQECQLLDHNSLYQDR